MQGKRNNRTAHALRRSGSPRHSRSRAAGGEPVPRPLAAIALAAGVRRPGHRPGAGRRLPAPRGLCGARLGAGARAPPCRTVEDVTARPPHSLHAYFLLGGDPKVPIIYEVDRIRDGKSFTTRNVKAIQHGRAIFSMSVSFHVAEPGLTHQSRMPEVPKPDALPSEAELKERIFPLLPEPARRYYERERPIEFRPVEFSRYLGEKSENGRFDIWIRATGRLPDEPAIHP